ncbi:MAG: hypothetical protein VR65_08160 [Desulfobulbaceae bacterium BRH_c16a]|nr:MAG: hypothetical protein VR65_08160 [Desulfobulbaceae bacterium BRH_c16a]
MIVRILIAVFASLVAGLSYFTGLARMMTGILLGFGALCSLLIGVLFFLPADDKRLLLPVYDKVPAWPYFLIAAVLVGMMLVLFMTKAGPAEEEKVSALHFKYFLGGIGGYLASMFLSSIYWFPSDALRRSTDEAFLTMEVLFGTCLFLAGITVSCALLYRASKGSSESHPDLMRRFVLGTFTVFHLDKMPLLVAYLLIYSPETKVTFPYIAAIALASYIPVGIFLLKTTRDCRVTE